eukprot:gene6844-13860_t
MDILRRDLLKQRVVAFEEELKDFTSKLLEKEVRIKDFSDIRRAVYSGWMECETLESVELNKKLDILTRKIDETKIELELDVMDIEAHFDEHLIEEIIANVELPKSSMTVIGDISSSQKRAIKSDGQRLQQSIDLRSKLNTKLDNVLCSLNKLAQVEEKRIQMKKTEISNRSEFLQNHFIDDLHKSKEILQKVTNDYLILRHNSRIAQENLILQQNESNNHKLHLQQTNQFLEQHLQVEIQKTHDVLEKQMNLQLNFLQNQIINYEEEIRGLKLIKKEYIFKRKYELKHIKETILKYNKKYNDLQEKRRVDIPIISNELLHLRSIINTTEMKILQKDTEDSYLEQLQLEHEHEPFIPPHSKHRELPHFHAINRNRDSNSYIDDTTASTTCSSSFSITQQDQFDLQRISNSLNAIKERVAINNQPATFVFQTFLYQQQQDVLAKALADDVNKSGCDHGIRRGGYRFRGGFYRNVTEHESGVTTESTLGVTTDYSMESAIVPTRREGLKEKRSSWRDKYNFHAASKRYCFHVDNMSLKGAIKKYGDTDAINIIRKELSSMESKGIINVFQSKDSISRKLETLDIGMAYLNANIKEKVLMMIESTLATILAE